MIRVLNIISDTNIGGAGRVLINYLKYRDAVNFDVSVLLPTGSLLAPPLRELGAAVYEADGFADVSYSSAAVKLLKAQIRKISPDIVHTHGSLSGRIAAKQCGKKVIYTRHSVFPVSAKLKSAPGRFVNRLINERYADRIIAVSPAAKENLTDAGISPSLIDVIMNGVEPVPRLSQEDAAAVKKRYGIAEDSFTVGILARFEPYKGHMDILDALSQLRREGRRVQAVMAGAGSCENDVRARVSQLGLEDSVIMAGFVTDVAGILSALNVQLNASWGTEATSLSLLEGMSMGLPAVVSDYGGNPYVIRDGANGLVFPARDSGALAGRLRSLMDSPELAERLSDGAKRIFSESFTATAFAKNIEKVYYRVMEGGSNGK